MIRCSFCGHEFKENQSRNGCSSCPMSRICNKYKCPNCGFEIPKETKLARFIKEKWGRKDAKVRL